ncbi:MAG: DUF721 domain-containing protein [Rhodothermaceae bacterium]
MARLRLYPEIKSLSEVFKKENGLSNFNNAAKQYLVVEKFPEIFPELSKIATATKIENKVLFLRVENSVWRNELMFKNKMMRENINKFFRTEVVKAIKFKY